METKDWVIATFSGLAFLWSLISYFLNKASAKEAGDRADAANTIAKETGRRLAAESEISILRLINDTRTKARELCLRVTELQAGRVASKIPADESRLIAAINVAYEEAVEAFLNAYELACGMYLDGGKLDNERFKRQYHDEIRRMFDLPEPYAKRLHPVNSGFPAIRKVHQEWHNLEKG